MARMQEEKPGANWRTLHRWLKSNRDWLEIDGPARVRYLRCRRRGRFRTKAIIDAPPHVRIIHHRKPI